MINSIELLLGLVSKKLRRIIKLELILLLCFATFAAAKSVNKLQLPVFHTGKYVKLHDLAQKDSTIMVEGIVVDELQDAIPGVSVAVKGSDIGTITNINGKYSIKVPVGESLVFSFIGMKAQEIVVSGQSIINITMQPEDVQIDEIVAIGYGSSKKSDITTSVSQLGDIDKSTERPVSTLQDFMQGKVAGVTVSQNGGDPTASPDVYIRGRGSVNDEPVLYIVDGLPYTGPALNPNDIESVSILKDAAASSIYGAQAAGGVIVIKTKKGRQGQAHINLNMSTSYNVPTNLPTPLNAKEQSQVYTIAAQNDAVAVNSAHNPTLNPWGQVSRTNWIDEIFRTGRIKRVSLDVSGASEKINYYTSAEYLTKEGILLGTKSERYAVRSKGDIYLTENITAGVNLYYSRTQAKGTGTKSGYAGTILNAIYMPSAASVYDNNGNYGGVVPQSLVKFAGAYGEVYNPVAQLLRPTESSPLDNFNGTAYLSYNIINGLKIRTAFAYNITQNHFKRFVPRIPEIGRANEQNYLYESRTNRMAWTWDNQITYNKIFGRHSINLTLVHSAQESNYDYFFIEGRNFSSEESFNQFMSAAGEIYGSPADNKYKVRNNSLIGRFMYNYAQRYYLSANIRRDETSKLNPNDDYQIGIFPAFSVAWRISKENFFDIPFINELKIRASWGKVGNVSPLAPYAFDATLSTNKVIIGKDGKLDSQAIYADVQSNSKLKWETTESYDIGLDAEFFNNKLSLIFDYFNKTTKDLLLKGLPDKHQGSKPSYVNGGVVENKGFELSIDFNNNIGSDFEYNFGVNFSMIKNELVNLDGYSINGVEYIVNKENVRSTLYPYTTDKSMIGHELYSYYLVPQVGIFQTQAEIDSYTDAKGNKIQPNAKPGDFKFQDTNQDGTIDDKDKVYSGSYMPDFTYGFNISLRYKRLDISMLFQGVQGVKIFNAYKYETYNAGLQGFNLDNRVLNAWSENNTGSDIPRLSTKDANHNFGTTSDWYLEDGSYFRLKNLTIGFTLPKFTSLISNAKVYISAENVFTLTKYSGMNPEVGYNGMDNGRYPLSKIFSMGLNIKF